MLAVIGGEVVRLGCIVVSTNSRRSELRGWDM